jgi:hypothetical protein
LDARGLFAIVGASRRKRSAVFRSAPKTLAMAKIHFRVLLQHLQKVFLGDE